MLGVIYARCHLCWVSFMLSVVYADCRKQINHAKRYYAECRYTECRYAECPGAFPLQLKYVHVLNEYQDFCVKNALAYCLQRQRRRKPVLKHGTT